MTEEKFNEIAAELRQRIMNECENFGASAPLMKQMMTSVLDAFDNSFQSGGRTETSADERVTALERGLRELQNRVHKMELEKMMQRPSCWPYEPPMYSATTTSTAGTITRINKEGNLCTIHND